MEIDKKWNRPFDLSIPIGTQYGVKGSAWHKGYHCGDDFLAPFGSDVKVGDNGIVEWVGDAGDGFGLYIRVGHSDMTKSYYTHLSKSFVEVGQVVMKGQIIALSGNSGNVMHKNPGDEKSHPVTPQEREQGLGSHCHFEVRIDGKDFKPEYEVA